MTLGRACIWKRRRAKEMLVNTIWAFILNNRARKDSQKVFNNLDIHVGDSIADIGSGGGFFTFKLAKLTGASGMVFAVDTNKKLLARIENISRKKQLSNIKTVLSGEGGCPLPKKSCDLIFMRNVFHHIKNPVSYFQNLRESIKPGGRIAVLDWESTTGGFVGRTGHCTPEAEIRRILLASGFSHLKSLDILDGQSFDIFYRDTGR